MIRSLANLLVVTALVGASAGTLSAQPDRAAPRRVDVVIDARMGDYTPRVIRVNRGDTVHVTLRALDTAHGFKVQGRDDVDVTAYPGMPVEITFVVDWEGGREWFCTFSCGPQHGAMSGMIVAEVATRD
jgi:heme/copper-type cytochrome/quinol oxidase subunit 2